MVDAISERQVGSAMPAPRTILRRVRGIHSHKSPVGPCCLTRDEVGELAPRGVVDALGEVSVLDHVPDTEVFDRNDIELVDNTAALLVSKVLPLPSGALINTGNYLAPLLTVFPGDLFFRILPDSLPDALFVQVRLVLLHPRGRLPRVWLCGHPEPVDVFSGRAREPSLLARKKRGFSMESP